MVPTSFRRTFVSLLSDRRPRRHHRNGTAHVQHRPMFLEHLEDRRLLAFVVNSTADLSDKTPLGDGLVDVDLFTPGNQITLRAAMEEANALAGTDTINFNIPGAGPHTIQPLSALPSIFDPMIIDGTTEPDYAGSPVVELDGSLAGPGSDGLRLLSGATTIRGLVINRFDADGMDIRRFGGNVIAGNFIGTDVTGTLDLGNTSSGIQIIDSANNTIGGTSAAAGNLISGNDFHGVLLLEAGCNGNLFQGNYIGTDITGLLDLGNAGRGIQINDGSNNLIGGSSPAARNVISGNDSGGIRIAFDAATDNKVQGNYVGLGADGVANIGNGVTGVSIAEGSSGNVVGTDGDGVNDAGERNVIAGNGLYGVEVSEGTLNVVAGNLIGTDVTGTIGIGNDRGIQISNSDNNRVGTNSDGVSDALERNVVAASLGSGITLGGSTNILVAGNFIGTDVTGTLDLGNTSHGIRVNNSANNTIGGTTAIARNLISGNDFHGVYVLGTASTGNLFQGNYIGTDISGLADLGNSDRGIQIDEGSNNLIGGSSPAVRNVISGNDSAGVRIAFGAATGNRVQGNYVGLGKDGVTNIGNRLAGVSIAEGSSGNVVGTDGDGVDDAGERNVIAGNGGYGVEVSGGTLNVVAGNLIGTDVTGVVAMGNGGGVQIANADNNRIGTNADGVSDALERNVVAASLGSGVVVGGTNNVVAGNLIGTDVTGTGPMPNGGQGVHVVGPSSNNRVGGPLPSEANLIVFSGLNGVRVDSGATGAQIQQNSIHSNAGLGIDLGNDGVTPNDPGDGDSGANNLQNFPLLGSAITMGGTTTIEGSLNSTPNTTFTLEFFANVAADPSGFGEGRTFIGATTVATNAAGDVGFVVDFAVAVPAGQIVSATATDPANNTSEFSGVEQVVENQPPVADADGPYVVDEGSAILLDGGGSFDLNDTIADYEWDFDYDGVTFDVDTTGVTPFFDAGLLDGPDLRVIALRVRDTFRAESVIDTTDLFIRNVDPVILDVVSDATCDDKALPGEMVTIAGWFIDAGIPDTHVAFVDWGDGSPAEMIAVADLPGFGTFTGGHAYATGGVFTITVTVTDDDGGSALATVGALVSGVRVDPSTGELQVVGTSAKDIVVVKLVGGGSEGGSDDAQIKVVANLNIPGGADGGGGADIYYFDPADVQSIRIVLCDGDDHANVGTGGSHGDSVGGSGNGADLTVPALIDGGCGNDHLIGGAGDDTLIGGPGNDKLIGRGGDDVLLGGEGQDDLNGGCGNDILLGGLGNDKLNGNQGRDILIGGPGSDNLKGGKGDDILIGGWTTHDTDLVALDAIMAEWTSERSYPDRIAHLNGSTGGAGENGDYFLIAGDVSDPATTVFDDGMQDTLQGDQGCDWYFADLDKQDGDDDRVKGKKNYEVLDPIYDSF